jgi:prepilin-type N-terminal cleavage/methylation domain-containing protein
MARTAGSGATLALHTGMTRFLTRARSQAGFTLIEVMVTLSISAIVGAMATAQLTQVRRTIQSDSAMRAVMAEMNTARDMAVMQRRNMELQFTGGNWVRVIRHEAPGIATTALRGVALESNATFALTPGLPDTPDAFGNIKAVAFGAAQSIMFGTDGTLIDEGGNPLNGTVFLTINGQQQSARAVTILGATGRIRGYRWFGGVWTRI